MTIEAEQAVKRAQEATERHLGPPCKGCGHLAVLHAAVGCEPVEGARCRVCQCAGLVLERERSEDNSADERAEGGA